MHVLALFTYSSTQVLFHKENSRMNLWPHFISLLTPALGFSKLNLMQNIRMDMRVFYCLEMNDTLSSYTTDTFTRQRASWFGDLVIF